MAVLTASFSSTWKSDFLSNDVSWHFVAAMFVQSLVEGMLSESLACCQSVLLRIMARIPQYCLSGVELETSLKVKEVVNEKGTSLTKLSQRSEVVYNMVRRLWCDQYTDVTLSTFQRLADMLSVDVSELIESVPNNDELVSH